MDQQNEYSSSKARKPAADHPWRKQVPSEVSKWAFRQSSITPVNNVVAARPETLRDSKPIPKRQR